MERRVNKSVHGYILALASAIVVAPAVVANVFSLRLGVSPFALLASIYAFAIVACLLTIAKNGGMNKLKNTLITYKYPMVAMGMMSGVMSASWIHALALVGPSLLGFLMKFSTVAIIALSILFLKERFTKIEALGGAVAFAGAVIISYGTGEALLAGVLLALTSCLFFALSQLVAKSYVSRVPPMEMNTIRLLFMLVFVSALGIATNTLVPPPIEALPFLVVAGLTGPFLSFYLYFKALKTVELSKVALISSIEPLAILIASYIVLGEVMTLREAVGSVVVFIGVMAIMLSRHASNARLLPEE
ncbi:MAG: DMT family transporter [Candidatus Aenigmarchaeota archaeon]|nr:DMT family transporter [Candidatus Aenigmarchaeota archaeon]